jgi:hypothetical protein
MCSFFMDTCPFRCLPRHLEVAWLILRTAFYADTVRTMSDDIAPPNDSAGQQKHVNAA